MKAIKLYIGLDVHKDSIVIAIADPHRQDEIRIFGTITNMRPAPAALASPLFFVYNHRCRRTQPRQATNVQHAVRQSPGAV